MNENFWHESWVWMVLTVLAFGLCTYLPIRVRNEKSRRKIYWMVLVPVSLFIIFYAYPVGMEVFSRWGNHF